MKNQVNPCRTMRDAILDAVHAIYCIAPECLLKVQWFLLASKCVPQLPSLLLNYYSPLKASIFDARAVICQLLWREASHLKSEALLHVRS